MNKYNEKEIRSLVTRELPEFVRACATDGEVILMTQDAFAYDGSPEELLLLGAAIKYAGLLKKEIRIIL